MPPVQPPPATALEALERARRHARSAGIELLAALRALVDAAALGWSGKPSEAHGALRTVARSIDDAIARLEDDWTGIPAPATKAVLHALDLEIARWEGRSAEDAEARAVLRTFLGLREILWEFGLRPAEATEPRPSARAVQPTRSEPRDEAAVAAPKQRVQRVEVQG